MAKIDQKKEKRERNAEYAKRFRKTKKKASAAPDLKRRGGKYGNWCRIRGHVPQCTCEYDRLGLIPR